MRLRALVLPAAAAALLATPAAQPARAATGKLTIPFGDGIAVVADDLSTPPAIVLRGDVGLPAWSPDGTQLAYARFVGDSGQGPHLEIAAADGTGARAVTAPGPDAGDTEPVWTPDGRGLRFRRVMGRQSALWSVDADGARPHPLLADRGTNDSQLHVVAGGARIVFRRDDELWGARADGTRPRQLATGHSADQLVPAPDGERYAFGDARGLAILGGATPLRRLPGTAHMAPVLFSPDGSALLANRLTGDAPHGTYRVDPTGRTPPRRLAGLNPEGESVIGFAGFGAPSWWTPAPLPPPPPTAPDRAPPTVMLRTAHAALTIVPREGARRPLTVAGAADVNVIALDRTGVRSVQAAWVRGHARPRWRDVTSAQRFADALPARRGRYRLLLRATDVLGHTTTHAREVIVRLTA